MPSYPYASTITDHNTYQNSVCCRQPVHELVTTQAFQNRLRRVLHIVSKNLRNGPYTTVSQNCGSRSIVYERGGWHAEYRFSISDFTSTLSIAYRDTPVFMVLSITKYINQSRHADIEQCIHQALCKADQTFPIRGEDDYEVKETGLRYYNRSPGFVHPHPDLRDFSGQESVTMLDPKTGHPIQLYSADYSGGIVILFMPDNEEDYT